MPDPVIIYEEYTDSVVGSASTGVTNVTIPLAMWESWFDGEQPLGIVQPGTKFGTWITSIAAATGASGGARLEWSLDGGATWDLLLHVHETTIGFDDWPVPGGWVDNSPQSLATSTEVAFRIVGSGGLGSYTWTNLNVQFVTNEHRDAPCIAGGLGWTSISGTFDTTPTTPVNLDAVVGPQWFYLDLHTVKVSGVDNDVIITLEYRDAAFGDRTRLVSYTMHPNTYQTLIVPLLDPIEKGIAVSIAGTTPGGVTKAYAAITVYCTPLPQRRGRSFARLLG